MYFRIQISIIWEYCTVSPMYFFFLITDLEENGSFKKSTSEISKKKKTEKIHFNTFGTKKCSLVIIS